MSPRTLVSFIAVAALATAHGQIPVQTQAPKANQSRPLLLKVQPGLETAVKWKWWMLTSDQKNWGLPVDSPDLPQSPQATAKTPATGPKKNTPAPVALTIEAGEYEVKRGDALESIARKAGITVTQLKAFNALPSDVIRIGQTLKIPTPAESAALKPPPAATPLPPLFTSVPGAVEPKKNRKPTPKPQPTPVPDRESEATLIQAFLDRENFSPGPITGADNPTVEMALAIYRSVHPDLAEPEPLRAKALAVMGTPFTTYKLKRSDFAHIAPPKPTPRPVKSKTPNQPVKAPAPAPLTYDDLIAPTYSAYRSPWEFVAERFHCDEAFLRSLNFKIKGTPTPDTEFKVPNVIPFEIEACFQEPLQPTADPDKPVSASITAMSRLEIRQGEQLLAVMPLSIARPDLRGRGFWTILDAVPRPQLATRQELRVKPATPPSEALTPLGSPLSEAVPTPVPAAVPAEKPTLNADQILAAGPRNPLGILWLNLAKANSTTPLPYGLHGTSIPSQMKNHESLGGLRLTNWDIARAVRLLPAGTPLQWK